MDADEALRLWNRGMVAFDLALGSGALFAPDVTLRVIGHTEPSSDARQLFRRNGPVWLTFAAAHVVAAVRDKPQDWWALAWLRGTELVTDVVWAESPGFSRGLTRVMLRGAGVANLAMSAAYAREAQRRGRRRSLARLLGR